jgi:AcrR family transcriptional regulator
MLPPDPASIMTPTTSPLGKRARNRQRTRAALVRAARQLFAERGFEHVRIEDITEAAGIGRRTFFRYFASKADVAFHDHAARIARFATLMNTQLPGEPPLVAVQRALVALGSEMMANAEDVLAFQAIVDASPALLAAERVRDREWDAVVATALAEGEEATNRDRVVAGALLGAVRATMRVWLDGGGEGDLVQMGLDCFKLLGEGLIPEVLTPKTGTWC